MKNLLKGIPGILFLFVFFSWFYVSSDWYVCSIFNKCQSDSVSMNASATEKVPEHFEKIYFSKDSSQVYLSDDVKSAYSIISDMNQAGEKVFNITGYYFSNEKESVGLQRALAVKELFKNYSWYDKITTVSKKVETDFKDNKYSKYNSAVAFNIDNPGDSFKIIGQNIHFGFNQSKPQDSTNIKTYLNSVAQDFKKNKLKVIDIVGHTDNKGNSVFNQALGLKRANMIKSMLVSFGVEPKIIKTLSFGDKKPAETNNTKEGRFLNRRVELIIK